MLPLLLAAGGAALSAKQAKDQQAQANRQAISNALMESGKTAYSGFTGGPQGSPTGFTQGTSPLNAAFSGGVAGYSGGQAIGQASAQQNMNNAYADILKQQASKGALAAPQPLDIAGGRTGYSRDYLNA
jgi:hypothetical protein